MDSSIKDIRLLLKKNNIRPSKKMGQNFLADKSAINKIVKVADIKAEDNILEIGPGTGALTKKLAEKAKKVVAVEKDTRMAEALKDHLKNKNIEIISQDILKIDDFQRLISQKGEREYKIVANLPYYITSRLIKNILESDNPPKEAILVMQKEVGQRICAHPPKMSLLAVSAQFYAETSLAGYISKDSFWPKPKVDAAIVKLKIEETKPQISKNLFFKIIRAGFSQPRKRLDNNLSRELKIDKEKIADLLRKCDLPPGKRAETLEIKDWICLANYFYAIIS